MLSDVSQYEESIMTHKGCVGRSVHAKYSMDTCWLRCEGARASETSGWRTERHMPSEVSVSANDISHAREVRDRADLSLCVITHQPSAEIGFPPHLNRLHLKLRTVSEDSGTAAVIALLNPNIADVDGNQVCKFCITAGLQVGLARRCRGARVRQTCESFLQVL